MKTRHGWSRLQLPPQRLELLPELFGVAYPPSREALERWLPQRAFTFVYDTSKELSVLCPERFIPPAERKITGLRVLALHPGGVLVVELLKWIEDDLRRRSIPATADCHLESDVGIITVLEQDLSFVVSLLAEAGHAVDATPNAGGESHE